MSLKGEEGTELPAGTAAGLTALVVAVGVGYGVTP